MILLTTYTLYTRIPPAHWNREYSYVTFLSDIEYVLIYLLAIYLETKVSNTSSP